MSLSHDVMKNRELLVQVIMKSVVATSAADMNCSCVIPDNVTSLTDALISSMQARRKKVIK